MKRGLITPLCILLMLIGMAQSKKQDSQLIGIEGTLTYTRHAQDDISFYTWSLYLTIDIVGGWSFYEDSTEVKKDIKLLKKYCDNFDYEKLEFNRNSFFNEKDIGKFLGNVKKGEKVKVFVLKSSLEEFLNGEKCMIYMESIRKVN